MRTLPFTMFGLLICAASLVGQTPRAAITPEMVQKAKFFIHTGRCKGIEMAVMDYDYAVRNCERTLAEALAGSTMTNQYILDGGFGTSPSEAWMTKLRGDYGTLIRYKWNLGEEKTTSDTMTLGEKILQPAIRGQIKSLVKPTDGAIRAMSWEELRWNIASEGQLLRAADSLTVLERLPLWVLPCSCMPMQPLPSYSP